MDAVEIRGEIARLKASDTTYRNCERLAILGIAETVLAGMPQSFNMQIPMYSGADAPENTELYAAITGKPIEAVLSVLQEHFDTIKVLFPREYNAVIRRLNAL